MPKFSQRSLDRLSTCDIRLQRILHEAIETVDFSVICGFRDKTAQDEAYSLGRSTVQWPNSKHNREPSIAVDVAPYPINWKDPATFARLAGYIERIAEEQGVRIRWGGDWNGNYRTEDERFVDMPHFEIVEEA